MLAQLETMISEYVELAAELRRKIPALGAIMGNHSDVTHPGHRAFYDAVCCWVSDFSGGNPSQEDLLRALELLLLSAQKYEKTAACWYLIAIQNHGKQLIPMLEESGRELLRQRYETAYPRGKRLPVQKEIGRMLGDQKRKLFRFL